MKGMRGTSTVVFALAAVALAAAERPNDLSNFVTIAALSVAKPENFGDIATAFCRAH